MSFTRKLERQAAKREKKMLHVPVLNAPDAKRMEVPLYFRDSLLKHYGLRSSDLCGEASFHIVFVIEGVVFGMFTRHGEQVRITLHILELDTPENIKLVGAEIFEFWSNLPTAVTFQELRERYSSYAGVPFATEKPLDAD